MWFTIETFCRQIRVYLPFSVQISSISSVQVDSLYVLIHLKCVTNLGLCANSRIVKRQLNYLHKVHLMLPALVKWCCKIFLNGKKSSTKIDIFSIFADTDWKQQHSTNKDKQKPSAINRLSPGHVKQVCNTWWNFPLLCNQKVMSCKLQICLVITWSPLLVKEDGGDLRIC